MSDQSATIPGLRLLFLSPVVPATSGNGLAMRAGTVLQLLSRHYRISLLVVRLYPPYDAPLPEALAHFCAESVIIPADNCAPAPARFRWRSLVKPSAGSADAARGRSRQMDEAGKAFRDVSFDVLHVFRLAMLPFARAYLERPAPAPRRHLDLDDVESTTQRRLADLYRLNGKPHLARLADAAANRSEALERGALRDFDRVYVCSDDDRTLLRDRGSAAICVLPNALPVPVPLPSTRAGRPFTFLFVGTLGYYPNEDAVRYFCAEVLPLIRSASRQELRVLIVGSGASAATRRLANLPGVKLVGPVSDVAPYYAQADAAIIPVRAGGGTRIKVLEAFRHECPVVSTRAGVAGIAARNGEHVLLGDTPAALADQCLRLMSDPALADRLAHRAAELFRRSYTIEAAARYLDACSCS